MEEQKSEEVKEVKVPEKSLATLHEIQKQTELLGAQRIGIVQGLSEGLDVEDGWVLSLAKGAFVPPPAPPKPPEKKPEELVPEAAEKKPEAPVRKPFAPRMQDKKD